jgi:hypothetical protein
VAGAYLARGGLSRSIGPQKIGGTYIHYRQRWLEFYPDPASWVDLAAVLDRDFALG